MLPAVQATLPWPVSPEFENALALATQRHLAQPPASPAMAPQLAHSPHQHPHSLGVPSPETTPSPGTVPRSASLMMKTRIAVRDQTPHRFQVVPLRDAAANREKAPSVKQPSATWTRQLAVLRPSGVGLGLNMRSTVTDTPKRGRERTRQSDLTDVTPVRRKGILRGLQGLSPKRQTGSPDGKENRAPGSRDTTTSPTKRGRRRREYTFDSTRSLEIPTFAGDATTTIQDHVIPTPAEESTQENTSIDIHFPELPTLLAALSRDSFVDKDITITELRRQAVSDVDSNTKSTPGARTRISRHFKSPSLGAIHHLLSASIPTTAPDLPDNTPRVRCRKRTNTLSVAHASIKSKRYGVYTPGKLDFSPIISHEDARNSTYSLAALLSAYSFDSLPSMYSQDSFVGDGAGTRPLRVQVRQLQGQAAEGQAHPIVMQLIREVDIAIAEWL